MHVEAGRASGPRCRPRPAPASSAGRHSRAPPLPPLRPHHACRRRGRWRARRRHAASSPTMPRMSYSRRMVGSNWCAVWLMRRLRDGRGSSVARLGPADAVIGEARPRHLLGIEDVAQVDDARLAHHLLVRRGSRPRNSCHSVITTSTSAPRSRLVGVLAKVDARQQLARLASCPRDRRRRSWRPPPAAPARCRATGVAHVVGVGLEGEAQHADGQAGHRAAAGVDDLLGHPLLARVVDLDHLLDDRLRRVDLARGVGAAPACPWGSTSRR